MTDRRWVSVAAFWTIAALLVTPLCGIWFSCGCDWPWDRFFLACNAVVDNAPLPHCPWCTHPFAAVLSIGLAIGAGSLAAWNGPAWPASPGVKILHWLGVTATFAGVLSVAGWLTAIATGYPTFLGMTLH
ncbi:MAG: hypothetical protein H6R26_2948 [Proteobacteria bacterium]|nr:hypothetical protein [Pseudomonadota bacterium]